MNDDLDFTEDMQIDSDGVITGRREKKKRRQIEPEELLEEIREAAPKYAAAVATVTMLENYSKVIKANQMKMAELNGFTSAVAQEREAYASSEYEAHLLGLKAAVEERELLRWKMTAAEAGIEVWRSREASNRSMDRAAR